MNLWLQADPLGLLCQLDVMSQLELCQVLTVARVARAGGVDGRMSWEGDDGTRDGRYGESTGDLRDDRRSPQETPHRAARTCITLTTNWHGSLPGSEPLGGCGTPNGRYDDHSAGIFNVVSGLTSPDSTSNDESFTSSFTQPILIALTSTDQCKNGGYMNFPQFKNQGQCVSYVENSQGGS